MLISTIINRKVRFIHGMNKVIINEFVDTDPKEVKINVFDIVRRMREQRIAMV